MAEITLNRPNWLESAVGLVAKTIQIPSNFATYVSEVDADGFTHKIVKSGTYVTSPYKGLLLRDIDITNGAQLAPLMIAGYYIDANLPASVAASASDLIAQGLFAVAEGSTTRPDFGSNTLTALTAPTLTDVALSTKFTWVAIDGATSYKVYKGTTLVATVEVGSTLEYVYGTNVGSYTVKAIGDNIFHTDSVASNAVVVA